MTEQTAGVAPAGWYPEPGASAGTPLRWWDGTEWTEHVGPAVPAHPSAEPAAVVAGGSQRWGTVWVWLLAASPWLLTLVTGALALNAVITTDVPVWHWIVLLVVPNALIVGLAIFDVRQLRQWHDGVATWAWSFLGAPVYLIARTLLLRNRGRFGAAPMWVGLANVLTGLLVIVGLVALGVWMVLQLSISMG